MPGSPLTRRAFLGAAGGAIAAYGCSRKSHPRGHIQGRAPGRALGAEELAVCEAACERIFPADADPGATRLGAVDYIDRRLSRPGPRARRVRRKLKKGLALLVDWSRKRQGAHFLDLEPASQDVALASLAAEGGDDGYRFVRQLLVLTVEGVLCDPAYGGNRDRGGWKIIGFDAPCPNPRCE